MSDIKKQQRICPHGHRYYKSSDCPVCPVCEKNKTPSDGFLSLIAGPARRALEGKGIKSLHQLSQCSEEELLALHGFGPSSIPKLRQALNKAGLDFRKK